MNAGMAGRKSTGQRIPVPDMSILKEDVVYHDEPKNLKELERHPEKKAIISSSEKEVQQWIDMQVGI